MYYLCLMPSTHPHIIKLLQCVQLEEKEQINRYSLDKTQTLKQLKAEGLALHPIIVTRKNFGYADYPEISFRLNFGAEINLFKDGAAIECFLQGEEPIKGVVITINGKMGEFRLFAPDFPDWIEDHGVGIKLAPDQRTTNLMKTALNNLEQHKELYQTFRCIHGEKNMDNPTELNTNLSIRLGGQKNKNLNPSQLQAVAAIVNNTNIVIIHGPPGTGKTTTLIEAIQQLVHNQQKVVVAAPSNTAVDHIAKGLLAQQLNILRVGNTTKIDDALMPHTPEGKLQNAKQQKDIRELKKRAEQFRKMALKYKRSFGKAEREQRNLLFKEVKNIRTEIKKIQAYNEEKLYSEATVILGTPIGLLDAHVGKQQFSTLVIDEAGQCIEPLAWCIIPLAATLVLAGDHLQLPPTVLSNEAARLGFNQSILEVAIKNIANTHLLNIQYRMRAAIAGFSSSYFYNGLLLTAPHLSNTDNHIIFVDTAGSGNNETVGNSGTSLQNVGELQLVLQLLEAENLDVTTTAFITPYSGQIIAANEILPKPLRCSTIDSFQGQEMDTIIISLVRSNDDNDIGFLKDYRRMNVAITRAKQKLYIIGDSATIAADNFYHQLITYIEQYGQYRTIWEFAN